MGKVVAVGGRHAWPRREPRHSLVPAAKRRHLVSSLITALAGGPQIRFGVACYQGAIRLTRSPAFGVVAIMLPVFAGVIGAAAPRLALPTTVLRDAATTAVLPVTAGATDASGPAVVRLRRAPTGLHIATAAASALPPPAAVNSTGALGIPTIALSAYRNAERMMAASDPQCGISWNLLAGIGRIESMHANSGATDARGTAAHPIYGPALDGTLPGNEVVVQSNAGGQVSYARAMGPMQFLPGTWARYAADGDGDGVSDPQNLYDSTLAAARYLCSGGLDLRDSSQVLSAILRYNNSMSYAQSVLAWAAAYANGAAPVDLPAVTGPAPALADMRLEHLENPEGIGPGLPLNVRGLPSANTPAETPLIELVPPSGLPVPQQPTWLRLPTAPSAPGCTVICIGQHEPAPTWDGPPP